MSMLMETSTSGLAAPTSYQTSWRVDHDPFNSTLPSNVLEFDPQPPVFELLKMDDDYAVYKKLILRFSHRAGITRMRFDCFELLFKRFQLIVAKG